MYSHLPPICTENLRLRHSYSFVLTDSNYKQIFTLFFRPDMQSAFVILHLSCRHQDWM